MKLIQTGQNIQMLRKQLGLTQAELAEKLFVSRDLVAKWETGARRPDSETAKKIAGIFGVSQESIISKDENLLKELSECVPGQKEISDGELTKLLNGFLHTLNERDCHIFLLRYYYMKSVPEIAEGYRMKEASVYSVLSRVRGKLKKYLSEASV